ncbi:MAG: preprotein translocase subunit SecE [Patescibacteria group bacterium]
MLKFIKDSYREFKKVQWPSRKQSILLTGYVIGVSLVIGLFVTGADYSFREALSAFLR